MLTAPDNMRRKEKKEAKEKRDRNRQKKSNAARVAAHALAGGSTDALVGSEAENTALGSLTLRPPSSAGSAASGSGAPQRPTTPHSDNNIRSASPANAPPKKKRPRAAPGSSTVAGNGQASSPRPTRTSQDRERTRVQVQSQPHPRPSLAQAGPITSNSNLNESRRGLTRSSSGGASSSAGARSRSTTNPNQNTSSSSSRRPSATHDEQLVAQEILTDRPSAPAYLPDSRNGGNPSDQAATSATLSPTASLSSSRRQAINIYSDLSNSGLPGAEEDAEDPDDLPPPFPEGATRPHSPPRPPQPGPDGEITWTEEDRRRQEEAEQYRVPDSPPPAFRSDEEGESGSEGVNRRREERRRHNAQLREDEEREQERLRTADRNGDGDAASDGSDLSSDGEVELLDEAVRLERAAWQADIEAGLSLEERITREQERRDARENQSTLNLSINDQDPERLETCSSPLLSTPVSPARAAHAAAQALAEELQLDNQVTTSTSTALPSLTTQLTPQEVTSDAVQNPPSIPSALRTETRLAAPKPPTKHRRVASDSRADQLVESSRASSSRPTSSSGLEAKRGRATRIRARPASESHSRFRDDATAAAERRRALWGSNASQSSGIGLSVPLAPLLQSSQQEHTEAVVDTEESQAAAPATAALASTPSAADATDGDSSSSEDAWKAEEEAFEAMQRREAEAALATTAAGTSSDSDEEEAPLPIPRREPSTSVSVPRAPPPLALGRSRGGAAYSSSSASSSDDEERNMESSSEDEFEEGAASLHSAPSATSLHSLGKSADKSLDEEASVPGAFSLARAPSTRRMPDPERVRAPRAFVPSEDEDQMIAKEVASLFKVPSHADPDQDTQQATIKGKGKGKAPERTASYYDAQEGAYVPITLRMESPPLRAGHFQEDSGSSKDFGSENENDEEDETLSRPVLDTRTSSNSTSKSTAVLSNQPLPSRGHSNKSSASLAESSSAPRTSGYQEQPLSPTSQDRAGVSSRLKGLFGTPLLSAGINTESTSTPPAPSPLLSPNLGQGAGSRRSSLRRSLSGREEMQESSTDAAPSPSSLARRPSSGSDRSSRRKSSGSSSFEVPQNETTSNRMTTEQKARSDALSQIASLHIPGHPRQDSLAALERLLSVGSRPQAGRQTDEMDKILLPQAGEQGSSRLSRQGAVVNRRPPQVPPITYPRGSGARPASFINPRSAAAPLPRQSRLPAITDATRHFPPSRNSSVAGAPPPWLSQINQDENGRLQRPLSPTRSGSHSASHQMPPPSLPLRSGGSRISAIISKFEVPTDEEAQHSTGRESPSKRSIRSESLAGSRPGSYQVNPTDRLALQAQFERNAAYGRGSTDLETEEAMRRRQPPIPSEDTRAASTNPFRNLPPSRPTSLQAFQSHPHPPNLQPPTSSTTSPVNHHLPEPSPRTQAMHSLTGQNWSSADAYNRRTPSPIPPPTESFNASLAASQAATVSRRRGGERGDPPPVPFRPQHVGQGREPGFNREERNQQSRPVEAERPYPYSTPPQLPQSFNPAFDPSRRPTSDGADLLGIAEILPTAKESRSSSPQVASGPRIARPLPRPPSMLPSAGPSVPPAPVSSPQMSRPSQSSNSTNSTQSLPTIQPSASTLSGLGLGHPPTQNPERPTPPQRAVSSTPEVGNLEARLSQEDRGEGSSTQVWNGTEEAPRRAPTREASLGITDLDLMVSQLEREGAHYEELAAIGEFLGPAKEVKARADEIAALPVGRVEVQKRRVNKDGKVKQKLAVVGVRVDKCAICMNQFKVDQMAALFPCQHM